MPSDKKSTQRNGGIKLLVLNYKGRDAFCDFIREEHLLPSANVPHPPINFHAYAAAARGLFCRDLNDITELKQGERGLAIVLLRRKLSQELKACRELRSRGWKVAIAWKEAGLHQVCAQIARPRYIEKFRKIAVTADYMLASVREHGELVFPLLPAEVKTQDFFQRLPTPYPLDLPSWDFGRELSLRRGVFVGTREFFVPQRLHMRALLRLAEILPRLKSPEQRRVTWICDEGGKAAKISRELVLLFKEKNINASVIGKRLAYPDYLQLMAKHRVVFQLDQSTTPGQVAGDCLLTRMPCVGGSGEVERIAFADFANSNNDSDNEKTAKVLEKLLNDDDFWLNSVYNSQKIAQKQLSFQYFRENLKKFV